MQNRLKLVSTKSLKEKLAEKGLLKLLLPKVSTVFVNMLHLGPRVILRSAFQLLRANIFTRIISTAIIIMIDLLSFIKRKISFKQLIINLVLSAMLLVGGTAGWYLGTDTIAAVVAENTVLWIIAGILGSGVLASVLDTIARKVLGKIIRNDIDDMLILINQGFEDMVKDCMFSEEEADKLAQSIEIDSKICLQCYQAKNRTEYISNFLSSYFQDNTTQKRD